MASFYVADTAALAVINTADPKGDGSVTLPLGFVMFVLAPGNDSPTASFILRDDAQFAVSVENWAVVPTVRSGSQVWINSSGVVAANNTPPSFTPTGSAYSGTEWKSIYTYPLGGLQWVEKWVFNGVDWSYIPSAIVRTITAIDTPPAPPPFNPTGVGSLYYDSQAVYIANKDLSGWTLLTTTAGAS